MSNIFNIRNPETGLFEPILALKGETGSTVLSADAETTLTGIIKGNGNTVEVAVENVDYQSPNIVDTNNFYTEKTVNAAFDQIAELLADLNAKLATLL